MPTTGKQHITSSSRSARLKNGLIFNAKEARKSCKGTLGTIPILSLILLTQKVNPLEFSSHQCSPPRCNTVPVFATKRSIPARQDLPILSCVSVADGTSRFGTLHKDYIIHCYVANSVIYVWMWMRSGSLMARLP